MKRLMRMILSLTVGIVAMFGMATLAYGDDASKVAEINEVVVDNMADADKDGGDLSSDSGLLS